MNILAPIIIAAYVATMGGLALFGLHRLWLVALHLRRGPVRECVPALEKLPVVTVQLPVYNERFVVRRLIDAVAALDYPWDHLQVQILDDSSDETVGIADAAVDHWRARGLDIQHLQRGERVGFKAGALEHGLRLARGELIAIFDADFVPAPDFLRRCVDDFADPQVGMVQGRWQHLNPRASALTSVQALMLDGHFLVEHVSRFRHGRFFNFNGTAGVFRRTCIESAGGWQHDTLTEDLDLSYRAQLAGWRFVFRPEATAAAELPSQITAFKAQQFRWAKGSIQTARKLLGRILREPMARATRIEAGLHLLNNGAYLLMAVLALLLPVAVALRLALGSTTMLAVDLVLLVLGSGGVSLYFLRAAQASGAGWWRRILALPLLFVIGAGLSVNNARAVIEALIGHDSPFLRTPKLAAIGAQDEPARSRHSGYRASLAWTVWLELVLALYYGVALVTAAQREAWWSLPWLALFFCGFAVVGVTSVLEVLNFSRLPRATVETAPCAPHFY
ncbi:MAG: glycosyltransferase [Pseudomonadota bacterium]